MDENHGEDEPVDICRINVFNRCIGVSEDEIDEVHDQKSVRQGARDSSGKEGDDPPFFVFSPPPFHEEIHIIGNDTDQYSGSETDEQRKNAPSPQSRHRDQGREDEGQQRGNDGIVDQTCQAENSAEQCADLGSENNGTDDDGDVDDGGLDHTELDEADGRKRHEEDDRGKKRSNGKFLDLVCFSVCLHVFHPLFVSGATPT